MEESNDIGHTFWGSLISCANMKWILWVLLKIQSGHDYLHRQTDGQGETSIPRFQLCWSLGYNDNWLETGHFGTNPEKIESKYKSFHSRNMLENTVKTYNISCTLVGNKIVDHSDAVGASPVSAAPTTSSSSFPTWHLASRDSAKTAASQYENLLSVGIWCILY